MAKKSTNSTIIKLRISEPLKKEIRRLGGKRGSSRYIKRAIAHYLRFAEADYDKIDKDAIKGL